jgi:hypothetical protein
MRVKPSRGRGNVLVEVGPRDSRLLAAEAEDPRLLRIKKILVPIDFSECSKKALR